MGFHSMLVQVTWVGVMLTTTMAAAAMAYPLALPNCSDSCGDVKIPYPLAQVGVAIFIHIHELTHYPPYLDKS